jgi:uncharacterized protein YidB (DUF937 family)
MKTSLRYSRGDMMPNDAGAMTGVRRLLNAMHPLWGQAASEEFSLSLVEFIARQGGASDVAARMVRLGMGSLARSWALHGGHEMISNEQLHQLFGTGTLRALAAKLGLQPRDLARQLSRALPPLMRGATVERGACDAPGSADSKGVRD